MHRFQDLAVLLASIAATLAALGVIGKAVRGVFKQIKRVNILIDQLLGDKDRGDLGLLERFARLEVAMTQHLEGHAPPGANGYSYRGPKPSPQPKRA